MLKKIFLIGMIGLDLFLVYWAVAGQRIDYMNQAAERQKRQEEGVRNYAETLTSDLATDAKLWELSLELLDGPKDRPSVIRKVKNWLPQAFTEEQGGFIQDVSFRKDDGTKADRWKVAWKKNSVTLEFDREGVLTKIDISALAGRSFVPVEVDTEADEEES